MKTAKLVFNYPNSSEVFTRDLAECYAKGNYTQDEYIETLRALSVAVAPERERTISDVMQDMQNLLDEYNGIQGSRQ